MLLWLLACAPTAPGSTALADASIYQQVMDTPSIQPEAGFARCAEISDPDTAGDCALIVALRAAGADERPPGTYCERVPEGAWRSECYFIAAEAHRKAERYDEAMTLCGRSTHFAGDCYQHLWQDKARRLAEAGEVTSLPTRLPEAEAMWRQWSALLHEDASFDDRFWRRFYQMSLDLSPVLDLGACDALEGAGDPALEHRARCRHAGAHMLLQAIRGRISRPAVRARFCGEAPPRCADLAGLKRLRCVDDPLLQTILDEQHDWVCVQGRRGPPPQRDTLRFFESAAPVHAQEAPSR